MATPTAQWMGFTGDPRIDGLTQGGAWTFGGGQRVITYSLDLTGFQVSSWTSGRIAAVDQIFDAYESFINVQFQRVGTTIGSQALSNADIAIGLVGNYGYGGIGPITALGVFPDPAFAGLIRSVLPGYGSATDARIAGDIFLNDADAVFAGDWAPGSAGFLFTMHEVGHALGLKHPQDNGASEVMPGYPLRKTFIELGIGSQDNGYYTVMTYNDVTDANINVTSGHNVTPMPYDILALQRIYGANMTYHTGNDTYVISNRNPATIWDAGGIDLVDGSGSSEAVWIDLRPGATFQGAVGGGQSTPGYAVAFGVTLENATGSGFGDTIWGNSAANVIDAGAGGDSIDGQGGDDSIQGGLGNDRFRVGQGNGLDTITDAGGNLDSLHIVGTQDAVRIRRSGDDLYVVNAAFEGAYLPNYFTLADKPIEHLYFVTDANEWNSASSLNSSQIPLAVVVNTAPVAAAPGARNSELNVWHRLSDFVSVSDANGDAMVSFQLSDSNAAAGSGYLWFNGTTFDQGASVTVSAPNLQNVWVRGGQNFGTDTFTLTASDGFSLGNSVSFDLVTRGPNRAPVATPTAATQGVPVGSTVQASTLFSVTDADGDAMTQYRFYDGGSGGGRFRVNGQDQAALQNITVNAADLANTVYVAGPAQGSETLWVQVYDGTAWSEWKSWTEQTQRTSNVLPVLNAPATRNAEANQWIRLSDVVSVTDADGDAMTRFELTDGNSAAGSGRLWFGGSYLTPGSAVTVSTSDLSQIWLQGGSGTGTDAITVRAHDGFGFGNTASFNLVTRGPNRAPVATPTMALQSVNIGSTAPVTNLFSVTDADGDAMTQYRFYDGGSGGGRFRVNGVDQGALQNITVNAADLGNTVYVAGGTAGSETLWVQVYDGIAWSEWKSWTERTQRDPANNARPVVTAPNRNLETSQWVRASELFSVSDADGDAMTHYEFTDNTVTAGGSANFWLNGVYPTPGQTIRINASQLSGLWVQGGSLNGTDSFRVVVNDGYEWSAPVDFNIVTRGPNRAPVVTPASAIQGVGVGNTVLASTLFNVSDADGDAMTQYRFYDGGSGGGRFRVNGVDQGALQNITVNAADLGATQYAAGATQGSETLWVQVYDGAAWSEWKSWTQQSQRTTNLGTPVIGGPATRNAEANQWQRLSDFLTLTDSDGDAAQYFEIIDANTAAGSGRVWFNGSYLTPGTTPVRVNTSDLSQIWVQGGTGTGTDTLTIRAHDGFGMGADKSFDLVTRGPNRAPVVTPTAASQGVPVGSTVAASTLFNVSDADNDSITQYQFYDGGAGGGQFRVNGVGQASNQSITVNAADLGNTVYAAGGVQGSETLWVRAYDGALWSEWKSWTEQSQRTTNILPVATAPSTRNIDTNGWVRLSDFITVSDGDGDAMTRFEVGDSNSAAGSARLWYNGSYLAPGAAVTVNTSDLSQIWVQGGASTGNGVDTITLRANDGFGWSNTVSVDLTTRLPNRAPVVETQDFATGFGQQMPVTRLFSVTDADGDAIQTYRFWDAGAGGGYFTVNGVAQPVRQNIDVSAADLANTYYVGGNGPGKENLSIQVYDGMAWSGWKTFGMSTASLVRFQEFVRTRGADTVNASQDGVYYGLGGDDNFSGFGFTATFFVGGSGGDTYNVGSPNNFSYVLESGGDSGSDRLNFSSFNFNNPQNSFTGIVDGRHLILGYWYGGDSFGLSFVFDWENPAYRIESFGVGSGTFNYADFRSRVYASSPEVFTYADLGVEGGVLNEEISYYRDRSAELDQPNRAPTVAGTAAAQNLAPNQNVQVSTLFTATDPDGDLVVRYEFTDLGAGGTLRYDGNVVNGLLEIHANELYRVSYQAGANGSTDMLRVRANDGSLWSPAVDLALSAPNHPITLVQFANPVRPDFPIPLRNLVSFNEVDQGDQIVSVEVTDLGASHGTLMYNGQAVAPNSTLTLTWAQTADVSYIGGPLGTSDTLRVRAYDGIDWSQPLDLSLVPVANRRPVLTVRGDTLTGSATAEGTDERVGLGSLITQVTDADNDAIAQYEFTDGSGASSGYLLVNGVAQAQGATVTLTQSQLANAWYVGGTANGSENLAIRVSDGIEWSDSRNSLLATTLNARPAINGSDFTTSPGRTLYSNLFFSATDADGNNTITAFDIRAPQNFAGFGGSNGVDIGNPNTWHPWNLSQFGFVVGGTEGSYQLSARAFDGVDWSEWKDISVTVATPVDGAGNDNANARAVTLGFTQQLFDDWVGSTDSKDVYRFSVNGSERVVFVLSPAEISASYQVRLFDAQGNSEMSTLTAGSTQGVQFTTPSLEAGEYYVEVTTGNGTAYTLGLSSQAGTPYDGAGSTYQTARMLTNLHTPQTFRDHASGGASSGYVYDYDYYGFTLAPGEVLSMSINGVTATDWSVVFAMDNHMGTNGGYADYTHNTTVLFGGYDVGPYRSVYGSQGGALDATVTNNAAFSQSYFLQIQPNNGSSNYTLTMSTNNLPKFTGGTRNVVAGEVIPGTALITATDADLDPVTQFRLIDNNAAAGSGYFTLNGVQQAAGQQFTVDAIDLGLLQFHAGNAPVVDDVAASGYDGREWGLWWHWNINTLAAPADGAGNFFHDGRAVTLSATPQVFNDWVGNSDGADIYTFTYAGDQPFHMVYAGSNPNATIRVELYQNNGGAAGSLMFGPGDVAGTTPLDLFMSPLAGGTYSVRITPLAGTNSDYSLSLSSA